jgi:hypothetical protein
VTGERVNPTIDWDTDQARAERHLRRFPNAAGMSDVEIACEAAKAVARRREARNDPSPASGDRRRGSVCRAEARQ